MIPQSHLRCVFFVCLNKYLHIFLTNFQAVLWIFDIHYLIHFHNNPVREVVLPLCHMWEKGGHEKLRSIAQDQSADKGNVRLFLLGVMTAETMFLASLLYCPSISMAGPLSRATHWVGEILTSGFQQALLKLIRVSSPEWPDIVHSTVP